VNGGGWRGFALGISILLIGGLSALVLNELVLSGIKDNRLHAKETMHEGAELRFQALEGTLVNLQRGQERNYNLIKVVVEQMILTEGELVTGPVPPEVLEEILNGN